MTLNPTAAADIAQAMTVLPEVFWEVDDDLCDCTYQRIGMWTNPYLAETLEVRMCCIWAKLYELFPNYVRTVPAFKDYNANEWVTEPQEWNGEADMPKAVWYRQLARKEGLTVAEARAKYADQDELRPRGIPRPIIEEQPGEEVFNPIEMLHEMVMGLAQQVAELLADRDRRRRR